MERRHPDLMLDESTAPPGRAVRGGEWLDRGAGFELVGRWCPNPVPHLRIDDLPVAHPGEVAVAPGCMFGGERSFLDMERVAVWVLRSHRRGDRVAFDHRVV